MRFPVRERVSFKISRIWKGPSGNSFALLPKNAVEPLKVLMIASSMLLATHPPAQAQTAPSDPPQPTKVQNSTPAAVSQQVREDFRLTMSQIALPGKGCFIAHFPNAVWIPTSCGNAPPYPNPLARGLRPRTVGGGNDDFMQVTGTLSSAAGSFDSITGVNAEYGSMDGNLSTVYSDVYSLQLNANQFSTPACAGASGCSAWEQFIFSQSECGSSACIFIEYWLLNHTSPCPAGNAWNYYAGTPSTVPGCFMNTAVAALPVQELADLGTLTLSGSVSGSADVVTISTANGDVRATAQDSILGLGQAWTGAEFNVVGDCCASEAFFNSGSAITVRLTGSNGTSNAPQCVTSFTGPTAETNNLNLNSSCSTVGGSFPAIIFLESGGGPPPATIGVSPPTSLGVTVAPN
jgi:hypothetical protein